MRNFTIQLLGLAGVSYAQAIPSSAQVCYDYFIVEELRLIDLAYFLIQIVLLHSTQH